MKVSAETAYPVSTPGPRVRLVGFIPELRRHGIELLYRPTLHESEYARLTSGGGAAVKGRTLARAALRTAWTRRGSADLRLLYRLLFLTPLPGMDPPRRIDAYDFDDALFVGSTSRVNRPFQSLKREAERWHTYIRRARLVLAGNGYLASRARQEASRVEVIPSCVSPHNQPRRTHAETEVVTIGWIGSASTSEYLRELIPVLDRLNADRLRARLVTVGSPESIARPWVEHRPWRLADESTDLSGFDIGVMPMPDTEWTRGKCGYKLLQYFAAGVPAVASPVGINRALIGTDRGVLASSQGEWLTALRQLIGDWRVRAEMGEAARAHVQREYSYERWAPDLAALLKSLA